MKVFKNTRKGGYSGGMILVAANSIEEAIEVFRADPKPHPTTQNENNSCTNERFYII